MPAESTKGVEINQAVKMLKSPKAKGSEGERCKKTKKQKNKKNERKDYSKTTTERCQIAQKKTKQKLKEEKCLYLQKQSSKHARRVPLPPPLFFSLLRKMRFRVVFMITTIMIVDTGTSLNDPLNHCTMPAPHESTKKYPAANRR